jgi:hypothetical protein
VTTPRSTPRSTSTVSHLASCTLPTHVWFIDLFRGCVGKVQYSRDHFGEDVTRLVIRYPRGRAVRSEGQRCHGSATEFCHAEATRCEFRSIGRPRAYYCDRHWITAGFDGTSPRDRAWVTYEGPREFPEPKEVK